MPHSRSSTKRVRQNEKNRISNLRVKGAMKSAEKEVADLLAAGKAAEAKVALSNAYAKLDKAAKVHVIHANTAANHKRKLATRVSKAATGAKK